ncbi:endoglucanase E-4-like [Glandiceps talaboti]
MAEPELKAPFAPETDDSSSSESDEVERRDTSKKLPRDTAGTDYYKEAIHKSILFYEAQRSGFLPAGNRVPWRNDSGLTDGQDVNTDLTGGWYDAGDHVKFNFPMAYSTVMLGWGLIEFWDSYVDSGELGNMLETLRWPCDYFIRCHPQSDVYHYAVGDPGLDHNYWGRPETMTMERPTWTCDGTSTCSDVAGETTAALSVCAMAFNRESQYKDETFATKCLEKAESLYNMAVTKPGKAKPVTSHGVEYYASYRFHDEIAWACLWLYYATGSSKYLLNVDDVHSQLDYDGDEEYIIQAVKMFKNKAFALTAKATAFSWNDKRPGVQLLMYKFTKDAKSKKKVDKFLQTWMNDVPHTPGGMAVRPNLIWGSNGIAANTALVALIANHYGLTSDEDKESHHDWAKQQIDAILGYGYDYGNGGHSFMVGFGNNPPLRPHHRGSSCPVNAKCGWKVFKQNGPNVNELTGAIVGGPDETGAWKDDRRDYMKNEVTTYYNSGLQSAVAALMAAKKSKG